MSEKRETPDLYDRVKREVRVGQPRVKTADMRKLCFRFEVMAKTRGEVGEEREVGAGLEG